MPEFEPLHFLRPAWLWAIAPALLLAGLAGRRQSVARQWRGHIAPHLLAHLIVRPRGDARPGPRVWLAALLVLACLALAGPSWQRESAPFADDRGQLLIVLDLSASMNAIDVAPTRLARARHKLAQVLALRQNARSGLLVFADSAHVVLPPTDDAELAISFLPTLESSVMPAGATPAAGRLGPALAKARAMLARDVDNPGGTVLVVSDGAGLGVAEAATLGDAGGILWLFGGEAPAPVAVNSTGAGSGLRGAPVPARDGAALAALTSRGAMVRVDATINDDDVQEVHRRIGQQLAAASESAGIACAATPEQARGQWLDWLAPARCRRGRDGGAWLLGPLVVLALLGFRRGWGVRW